VKKILFSLAAVALVATACNKAATPVTLSVGHVPSTVKGDVVSIPVNVTGITIVKPNGDTSGKTGHFHVFVDRRAAGLGQTIPKGVRGIVHSEKSPVMVYGLTPGEHTFHIVLGNGAHVRIDRRARATIHVKTEGPAVQGSAPATITKGQDLVVKLQAWGVKIVDPGTESSPDEGHYHVLVDPATPPQAGAMIADSAMAGASPSPSASASASPAAMMPSATYMTGSSSQTITGLTPGEHVIWVVLADKDHKAWSVPVMDMFKVTVV
jgi:hypothetical protein